jgi:hypothetical protein
MVREQEREMERLKRKSNNGDPSFVFHKLAGIMLLLLLLVAVVDDPLHRSWTRPTKDEFYCNSN